KVQKISIPDYYFTPSYQKELANLSILFCNSCKLVEVVDIKKKESILKTRLREKSERGKSTAGGMVIAFLSLALGVFAIFYLEIYDPDVDIQILPFTELSLDLTIGIGLLCLGGFIVFLGMSVGLIKYMQKHPSTLEFTMRAHRLTFGDDEMYFFEYSTEREQISFKATLARSFYGSILVLGIGILIIENFFTIPDLQEFKWTASYIVIFSILIAFPLIMIYLYTSPLLTKEINLFAADKKNRNVKNVGEWLDNSLQFFAVIDIILTGIIIIDSNLGPYIIIIGCLVLIVFAWILIFTTLFNNYYHAEMKNHLKDYLRAKYALPIRQVRLAPQFYYCQQCGDLLDFIHDDECAKCNTPIFKCMVCGDVMTRSTAKFDKDGGQSYDSQSKLDALVKKVEKKLDKVDEEHVDALFCSECGLPAHADELYSWVELRGTCPACKKKITLDPLPFE
nr:hypothetical protein [Candidatus Sigynarchaeota archaeon]